METKLPPLGAVTHPRKRVGLAKESCTRSPPHLSLRLPFSGLQNLSVTVTTANNECANHSRSLLTSYKAINVRTYLVWPIFILEHRSVESEFRS